MSNFSNNGFSNNGGFPSLDGANLNSGFAQPALSPLQSQLGQFGTAQPTLQSSYNFGLPQANSDESGSMTMSVRKLYLGLTRPQNQQHRRSYDVMLTGTALGRIQEEIEKDGVQAFNPMNLGNLMSTGADLIRHSGTPEAAVNIDNGWETERFRFTMVVDVYRNGKFNRTEFISGYTDHPGVMNMGMVSSVSVDPNMIFVINHVTEARVRQMDQSGRPVPLVTRSNAVVRNNSYIGMGAGQTQMYMTRPTDVLRAVDKVSIYQGMQAAEGFGDQLSTSYQDLDSMLTSVPMCSSDTNLLIPTFASRTLRGLYEHSLSDFDPMNMDNTGKGMMASNSVADTPFSNSGFIHVMNRKLANHVATTASFTYGDLLMLDHTIDDRADIFGRSYESGSIVIPDGRDTHSLGSAETISLHATSIVQTTIALMSLAGVATLAYNANNNRGNTEIVIQACDGIDADGMLAQRLETLKQRLRMECLSIMSISDEISYDLDVFADVFNDVYIQFTWDGVRRDYVIPSYASSSFAPVVTNDLGRLVGMAEAIDQVVDSCKHLLNPGMPEIHQDNYSLGNGSGRVAGLAGDF